MSTFASSSLVRLCLLLLLAGGYASFDALAAVGRIQFVSGDVKIRNAAGQVRAARKGDPVDEGDTLLTGMLASAQVKMIDGGVLAIRPDTELKIDNYVYKGVEDGSERALMSLLKGGFRTITGIIGRANKQNYTVNTPTSTIGIRGTDHEPAFIPPVAPGLKPPPSPPGTYDKVNLGIAFIRSPLGEVDIRQNQVGFAAPDKPPVLLPRVPDFFKATPPIRQVTEKEKEAEKQKAAAAQKAAEDKGTPAPEKTAEKPAATAAAEPSEVRSTTVVDSTAQAAPLTTAITAPEPTTVITTNVIQPVTGTADGATLNLTTQTVTTSSGTTALTPGVTLETVPSFPNNANVRHNVRYLVSEAGSPDTFNLNARNAFNNLVNNPALSGPTTNTNYLFDFRGNLLRVLDTPYVVFDHATDLAPTSTQFATPTPLAHARLSFGSGATASESYFDPIAQIRLGRWQGGVVNVTDLATGASYVDSLTAPTGGARSVLWEVHQAPSSLPVSGQFHYTRIPDASGNPSFATAPVDSYGNVGTLDGARLTADFTRMTVSAGMRVTMPSGPGGSLGIQNLASRFSEAPIQNLGFNVSSNPANNPPGTDELHISCFGPGCAPNQTYGGRIRGGFTSATGGATAEGAFFRYTFNTNYPDAATAAANGGRVNDDYIDGLVAFRQGPAIVPLSADINTPPNPPGDAAILYAYAFSTPSPQTRTVNLDATAGGYTVDAGNLTQAAGMFFDEEQVIVLSPSGATNATAPNGIVHGYLATPTLSGTDFNGQFMGRVVSDSFHWVRGPAMYPWYASSAMVNPANIVGNVNYARVGAFVTDQNNSAGAVSSASLSVNFNQQSVNATVNAFVPGGAFGATANGLSLDDGGGFWASSNGPVRHTFNSLTFSGGGSVFGSMNGSLMGQGLNGAGLVFSFSSGTSPNRATGSVVFGSPTYNNGVATVPFEANPLMDFRLGLVASGMSALGAITRDGSPTGPLASEEANYAVQGGAISSVRTQFVTSETAAPVNPRGALIKFDGPWRFAFNSCSPSICNSETQIAARYALADATGGGPTVTNLPATPPTARSIEFGFDQDTGVRWGRWGGGVINVGDRASANQAGTVPTPNGTGSMSQIDLSVNNWHYLITTGQGGPVVLPVSGTANYTLVGFTSPTDNFGNVGALGSAMLTANFTAKTVDTSVNLNVAGSNWAASAAGVPIQKGAFFEARKSLSGMGPLSVTRDGSPASTAGQIVGGFAGQTGRGAGIAYSLNQGGPTGTTVSGVAVFKR